MNKIIYQLWFDAGLRTFSNWTKGCGFYAVSDREAICIVDDLLVAESNDNVTIDMFDIHPDLITNILSKRVRLVKILEDKSFKIVESWD